MDIVKAYGDPVKGRNKRSVWKIATQPFSEVHFATFPETLPETCIKASTKKGDTVMDIFAGSGTTLSVASRLGRKSIGIELSPEYIKILKRDVRLIVWIYRTSVYDPSSYLSNILADILITNPTNPRIPCHIPI